jgi:hypothetical protein
MAKKKCQSVSEQHCTPQSETSWPSEEPRLSPTRAFVVQFREETDPARMRFTGRVEHMVSGRAARFHSPQELLAFFTQVLNTIRAKPP